MKGSDQCAMVNFRNHIDRFWIKRSKDIQVWPISELFFIKPLTKGNIQTGFSAAVCGNRRQKIKAFPLHLSLLECAAPHSDLSLSLSSSLALSFQTSFSLPLTSSIGIESLTPSLRAPHSSSRSRPTTATSITGGNRLIPAKTRRRRRWQGWSCICNCITAAAACAYFFHWIAIAIAALELSQRLQLPFANSETPTPPPPYIYLQ